VPGLSTSQPSIVFKLCESLDSKFKHIDVHVDVVSHIVLDMPKYFDYRMLNLSSSETSTRHFSQ
jgi:hypothetical protein